MPDVEPTKDEELEFVRQWAENHRKKGAGEMVLGLIARIELAKRQIWHLETCVECGETSPECCLEYQRIKGALTNPAPDKES